MLYWRPPRSASGTDATELHTEVAGARRTVVETKTTFDYGKDVLVCNLMTDSKERHFTRCTPT